MKTGTVFWITGLSGAGKSTLAKELQIALEEKQVKSIILDGDELRKIFTKDFNSQHQYTREMRLQLQCNIQSLSFIIIPGFQCNCNDFNV